MKVGGRRFLLGLYGDRSITMSKKFLINTFRLKQVPMAAVSSRVASGGSCGFTLIEILAVLILLGILAVVAVVHYASLLDDSKSRGASILVAAAQSQLSLEFARRATAGLTLDTASQAICDWVVISSTEVVTTIVCVGNLTDNVSITATIDSKSFAGSWNSPLAGGS